MYIVQYASLSRQYLIVGIDKEIYGFYKNMAKSPIAADIGHKSIGTKLLVLIHWNSLNALQK